MPIEKTTTLYYYNELSDEAKATARMWYAEGADFQNVYECLFDDAERVGLKIKYIGNRGGKNKAYFITSAPECAENILANHGKDCETYKTAKAYLESLPDYPVIDESEADCDVVLYDKYDVAKQQADDEFLYSLLEDYRIIGEKECEYQLSDAVISENIWINEYTFTVNGKRAD